MNLIERQIEFLLEKFFTHHLPGAPAIARELLTTGSCIVAGNDRIWFGVVDPFIEAEPAPNAVDCTLLRFNLREFLDAPWVKDIVKERINQATAEIVDLQESRDAMTALLFEEPQGATPTDETDQA